MAVTKPVLLSNAVVMTVEPSLSKPLALTENWVWRTPWYQKSKPMLVTADAVSSTLAATSWVVPVDMSSRATPVALENG